MKVKKCNVMILSINEEFLSEVFGREINSVHYYTEDELRIVGRFDGFRYSFFFNIYHLAHECKEWAFNLGYKVISYKHDKETYIVRVYKDDKELHFSTEHTQYECDINACQWIYENIKRKN